MTAKMKDIFHGRTLYIVNAFPSSVPGKTSASITTVVVTDAPRIRWNRAGINMPYPTKRHLHFNATRRTPTYMFMGYVKESWPNATFSKEPRRHFCDDEGFVYNTRGCRRPFLKLKQALAYQKRIMAEQWNSHEREYIRANDIEKRVVGHN